MGTIHIKFSTHSKVKKQVKKQWVGRYDGGVMQDTSRVTYCRKVSRDRWVATHRCPTAIGPVQPPIKFRQLAHLTRAMWTCAGEEKGQHRPGNHEMRPTLHGASGIHREISALRGLEKCTYRNTGVYAREASNG